MSDSGGGSNSLVDDGDNGVGDRLMVMEIVVMGMMEVGGWW